MEESREMIKKGLEKTRKYELKKMENQKELREIIKQELHKIDDQIERFDIVGTLEDFYMVFYIDDHKAKMTYTFPFGAEVDFGEILSCEGIQLKERIASFIKNFKKLEVGIRDIVSNKIKEEEKWDLM